MENSSSKDDVTQSPDNKSKAEPAIASTPDDTNDSSTSEESLSGNRFSKDEVIHSSEKKGEAEPSVARGPAVTNDLPPQAQAPPETKPAQAKDKKAAAVFKEVTNRLSEVESQIKNFRLVQKDQISAVDSLIDVHEEITRSLNEGKQSSETTEELQHLQVVVEGKLEFNRVRIVKPKKGDPLNTGHMEVVQWIDEPGDFSENTVVKVLRCSYSDINGKNYRRLAAVTAVKANSPSAVGDAPVTLELVDANTRPVKSLTNDKVMASWQEATDIPPQKVADVKSALTNQDDNKWVQFVNLFSEPLMVVLTLFSLLLNLALALMISFGSPSGEGVPDELSEEQRQLLKTDDQAGVPLNIPQEPKQVTPAEPHETLEEGSELVPKERGQNGTPTEGDPSSKGERSAQTIESPKEGLLDSNSPIEGGEPPLGGDTQEEQSPVPDQQSGEAKSTEDTT